MSNIFAFVVGDVVTAKTSTQGLEAGVQYKVVDMDTQPTPFGYFVQYKLEKLADNTPVANWIFNGHLILTKVQN